MSERTTGAMDAKRFVWTADELTVRPQDDGDVLLYCHHWNASNNYHQRVWLNVPAFDRNEIASMIAESGMVIAPAADVLTSEMRADIAWVCGIVGQIDHFNMDEWPVIERLRAIADGGAK